MDLLAKLQEINRALHRGTSNPNERRDRACLGSRPDQLALLAAPDVIGRRVERGIASVLVGEPEFELVRLKRKTCGAHLRGDGVAEIDAMIGGGLRASGRHSVDSAVAHRWRQRSMALVIAHHDRCPLNNRLTEALRRSVKRADFTG